MNKDRDKDFKENKDTLSSNHHDNNRTHPLEDKDFKENKDHYLMCSSCICV